MHYGRYGHPTGSCVAANPIKVTTFLAEDRKALLGVLGFFLGFFLRMDSRLRGGGAGGPGVLYVYGCVSICKGSFDPYSGAAQAGLRLGLGASL